MGDWKIVADHNFPWELYNMKSDKSETINLAGQFPEKVNEMEKLWFNKASEFYEFSKQDVPLKSK